MLRWRDATTEALYGPRGFFTAGHGPAAHFRTSAHTVPMARAVLTLLARLDAALGAPTRLDLVDVGAGGGELLSAVLAGAPADLAARLRLVGVDRAPRPSALPQRIAWRTDLPAQIIGLLLATEWLDNVPVDVAERDADGTVRVLLVDPETGAEAPGPVVTGRDAAWLADWWPLTRPGTRAEIGWPRDDAWSDAVGAVERGLALAVDYGHLADCRPPAGTLTGYLHGRQIPPVPDGSTDVTAHVAWDPLVRPDATLLTQRAALRTLGITGRRPPLETARTDPAGYLAALAAASHAAELTDPAGLGGHHWLYQPVGLPLP